MEMIKVHNEKGGGGGAGCFGRGWVPTTVRMVGRNSPPTRYMLLVMEVQMFVDCCNDDDDL